MPYQGHYKGDLCSWLGWPLKKTKSNNAYLPLHDIPFWKWQTKDISMVTSAADLGDLQTKPNQIMHIYPYMIYLFENPTPRTMQWWPLQLICVTSKPNNSSSPLLDIPFSKHHTKDMAMVTSAALKKVYHVWVNIHLFGDLYWRSILEVTQCRCRGI